MVKALMIQGTGSGVGKSLIVTALCRIFNNRGIKVAPFKAQNMALNSYITKEGGEIGRAQALQAEAARIESSVDMNPVLLKASGEKGSQVIIHGRVHSTMRAKEYYEFKKTAWEAVVESFERLSKNYELIIIEGAGSPAEINLMDKEIVNMRIARYVRAPVILVGDIDRGGVFASLYGTVKLLGRDARYIKAFVINKFRGDLDILTPGLQMIKEKTGRPVIGVLPYIKDLDLPEEDSLALYKTYKTTGFNDSRGPGFEGIPLEPMNPGILESFNKRQNPKIEALIRIVVVRLEYISNFTDFDPFLYEPDVELVYSDNPADIENADIVIIPGTKNTVKDLLFLKERHLDESIKRAYVKGIQIIGICGGYQMLGKKICDPYGIESDQKEIDGIGLLDIETTFERTKITAQTIAEITNPNLLPFSLQHLDFRLKGYEIHMGTSKGDIGIFKIKRITSALPHCRTIELMDGSINRNCFGTYLHGIFEDDSFRRAIINQARKNKGLSPIDFTIRYSEIKDRAINNLAKVVIENMDMDFIRRLIKL